MILIEDGGANAANPQLYLFVVDGIASAAHSFQCLQQRLGGTDCLRGSITTQQYLHPELTDIPKLVNQRNSDDARQNLRHSEDVIQ